MNSGLKGNVDIRRIFNVSYDSEGFDFLKVNSYGNDFMIIHEEVFKNRNVVDFVRRLGDRNFGVGFEQLLSVCEPKGEGDFDVKIYNSDGSNAKMCGNGMVSLGSIFLEHLSNRAFCDISIYDNSGFLRSVHSTRMPDGAVIADINVFTMTKAFGELVVDNGNKHIVKFYGGDFVSSEDFFSSNIDLSYVRAGFNINHVVILESGKKIAVMTVENGVGETLSCGTGCCASAAWAIDNPVVGKIYNIELETKGGREFDVKPAVQIVFSDMQSGKASLKGVCKKNYKGHFTFDCL